MNKKTIRISAITLGCLLIVFVISKAIPNNISSTENKPTFSTEAPTSAVPTIGSNKNESFHLYTRVTPETWPKISKHAKEGDLFWGPVDEIPKNMRALTISSYENLINKINKDSLNKYAAINWDSEGKDFYKEYQDAQKIRKFIDQYNQDNKNNPNQIPLRFTAFFHLNIIEAYPEIVSYPDVILVGKTSWNNRNISEESSKFINLIKSKGKTPGILLGEKKSDKTTRTKVSNSQNELDLNFESVVSDAGLGLEIVSFYYDENKADTLVNTLENLR